MESAVPVSGLMIVRNEVTIARVRAQGARRSRLIPVTAARNALPQTRIVIKPGIHIA